MITISHMFTIPLTSKSHKNRRRSGIMNDSETWKKSDMNGKYEVKNGYHDMSTYSRQNFPHHAIVWN